MRRSGPLLAAAAALIIAVPDARAQLTSVEFQRRLVILDAEDRRATDYEFQALAAGADVLSPATRQLLVRAMGRAERPSLIPQITAFLTSRDPATRGEAANALAQSVHVDNPPPAAVDAVQRLLLGALKLERDEFEAPRGVIARSLGRLRYSNVTQVHDAEAAIVDVLKGAQRRLSDSLMREACIALESLFRINRSLFSRNDDTLQLLTTTATSHIRYRDARAAAIAALIAAGDVDVALVDRALSDPDVVEVRRLAAAALRPFAADRPDLLDRALRDRAAAVRLEALRSYGMSPFDGCGRIVDALTDRSDHVAILAIDLLGGPCTSDQADIGEVLAAYSQDVRQLRDWHRGAHAIVALAARDRRRAADALPAFTGHLAWEVRVYAARAAAALKDVQRLKVLADDRNDNVRQAALVGLHALLRHEGDEIYLENLKRRDYQLLLTAAAALEGTPLRERTAAALFEALVRVTAEKKETSREVRLMFLQRLREVGDPTSAPNLKPYLSDFDVRVCSEAADLYARWTETRLEIDPHPLPRPSLPTVTDFVPLQNMHAVVRLRWAGMMCLSFNLDAAPLTVVRFAGLVRRGYYNGLTFHRVIPNFIAQGGSPGANDYAGNDRYWRDEIGVPHTHGAVAVASRGRDAADAQVFIDFADNLWLTNEYTVFATVESTDVLDRILEGDTIDRIDLAPTSVRCR